GAYATIAAAAFQKPALVFQDLRIASEIGVDEAGGFVLGHAEAGGETERADAVNHAEVYCLGGTPHVRGHIRLSDAKNLRRHGGVDVAVVGERASQRLVAAEVSQQA